VERFIGLPGKNQVFELMSEAGAHMAPLAELVLFGRCAGAAHGDEVHSAMVLMAAHWKVSRGTSPRFTITTNFSGTDGHPLEPAW
jgi:hypothetical protein